MKFDEPPADVEWNEWGPAVRVRVVDSTKQVLQYGLARPFGADDPSAWFRQVAELDAGEIPGPPAVLRQ